MKLRCKLCSECVRKQLKYQDCVWHSSDAVYHDPSVTLLEKSDWIWLYSKQCPFMTVIYSKDWVKYSVHVQIHSCALCFRITC